MGNASGTLRSITGTNTPNTSNTPENDIESARTASSAQPENVDTTANGNNLYLGPQFFRDAMNNVDLSFLSSLGRRAAPPQMHQTTTVKCPVNLNRNSLQLILEQSNDGRCRYRVQFLFDSTESGTIRIYYAATEDVIQTGGEMSYRTDRQSTTETRFERGLGQAFEQRPEDFFDASTFTEEQLSHNAEERYYPVVIVIQSDSATAMKLNSSERSTPIVTQQTTFANVIHCSDDTYVIKPIKQKILCSGRTFIVHDIFGLENGENETGRECVICMTDARDTAVLPCRHLCLCSACAEELRQQSNKCPICRSTVKHMVEIKIGKDNNSNIEREDSAEDLTIMKPPSDDARANPILMESWTQDRRDPL